MLKFPKSLHLIQDFIHSEDYIFIKDIKSIGNSYKIFSGNYGDFKKTLQEHKEKSDDRRMWHDKQIRYEILDRLARLMYNFFSSAFTLVYHTRNHMNRLYKPNSVMALAYQQYINEYFVDNPLHGFVIDFRNFLCHSTLPYLLSVKKYGHGGGATTFEVKKASLENFKWKPIADTYISNLPDTFDIEEIVDQYFREVENLHKWYRFKQLQLHKEVYSRVLTNKKALLKLAIEDGVTGALPYDQADIEKEEEILQKL